MTDKALATKPQIIVDFSVGQEVLDREEVFYQASVFLTARKAEKGRLLSRVITATIEEGIAYQYMFDFCQEVGVSWEQWVIDRSPYDPDTARNYRNLANKFRELIVNYDETVIDRVKLGALYKLAVQGQPIESAITYFDMLVRNPELKGDVKLAEIAKDPEIANRVEKNELTVDQAYDLILALRDCNEFINQFCRSEGVQYGGVARYLNHTYLDWVKQRDELRPNKSWADIVNNGNQLVWSDKTEEYRVHISDAVEQDCRAYRDYRQSMHIGGGRYQQSRATAKVTRTSEGHIQLILMDSTALPVNFSSGTILVDLLPDTLSIDDD